LAGDWAARRPGLRPGGWAFQYANPHYPDLDDSAVVLMALDQAASRFEGRDNGQGNGKANGNGAAKSSDEAIQRGEEWLIGMQSRNGGWGSFDADNTHGYLNAIPFADHGALLDPPTADVTARCLGALCQLGRGADDPVVARGLAFLKAEQEPDGSWFGRWGTNYIYGTWSAMCAFRAAGEDLEAPHIRRAVRWLTDCQREDGGWGEDGASYWSEHRGEAKASTPAQTAWALLALMAAGEAESAVVRRGIDWLLNAPREGTDWEEPWYTAVGFPRVFYLRYHGYRQYFPLWALARYRNVTRGNAPPPALGM
jgi:squalene-hopene/tetraprenyl-beta-curcumene cyclase